MWAEAVLLPEDLDRVVAQMTPMAVAVGASHLLLFDASPCVLVPDIGLRIVCKAKVQWPVLGVDVPVTARSLTLLLRPAVARREEGEALVITLAVESAELTGVPGLFEQRIMDLVNKELVKKEVELSWGFAKTLTHSFRLPGALAPLDSLDLEVLRGRVQILGDRLALAVQFGSSVKRHDVAAASP
jgi:hypothetical protein